MPDPMPPEYRALAENLLTFLIADATQRQARDKLIATWRDSIHAAMMETVIDLPLLHKIIDSMDEYLRRSKN